MTQPIRYNVGDKVIITEENLKAMMSSNQLYAAFERPAASAPQP